MGLDRGVLARLIDHTLLAPEATRAAVAALCREATELGVFAVCVSPSMLPLPADALGPDVAVACVTGFPSGAHRREVKVREAELAVADGADEIDLVINLAWASEGRWDDVGAEIAAVRGVVEAPRRLKVIIESAVLDEGAIVAACRAAEMAGADFVKTSTGFHRAGGATPEAVRLMRATVADHLGVKASGGIRSAPAALAMVEAGASRLGTSASATILAAWPAP